MSDMNAAETCLSIAICRTCRTSCLAPHTVSVTLPDDVAELLRKNLRRLLAGAPLLNVVAVHHNY